MFRIGQGFDLHTFVDGRPLIIGGIEIPYHLGLAGHSDADVLLHAIIDALIGAAALGDIGKLFPDNDEKYKGIDSKILLSRTYDLITAQGYQIVNIDATLCLEAPKIKPYVLEMQACIASILKIGEKDISIKATTTETMGFTGRQEGLVALATCLLSSINS